MADQENYARQTKKRTAPAICELSKKKKKKRIVLGDLTNLVSPPQNKKNKNIAKPKPTAAPSPETEILNGPELCGSFESELDESIRETEVDLDPTQTLYYTRLTSFYP